MSRDLKNPLAPTPVPNRVKIRHKGRNNQGSTEYVRGDQRSVEIGRDYQGDQRRTVRRKRRDGTYKTTSKKISDRRAERIIRRKERTHKTVAK